MYRCPVRSVQLVDRCECLDVFGAVVASTRRWELVLGHEVRRRTGLDRRGSDRIHGQRVLIIERNLLVGLGVGGELVHRHIGNACQDHDAEGDRPKFHGHRQDVRTPVPQVGDRRFHGALRHRLGLCHRGRVLPLGSRRPCVGVGLTRFIRRSTRQLLTAGGAPPVLRGGTRCERSLSLPLRSVQRVREEVHLQAGAVLVCHDGRWCREQGITRFGCGRFGSRTRGVEWYPETEGRRRDGRWRDRFIALRDRDSLDRRHLDLDQLADVDDIAFADQHAALDAFIVDGDLDRAADMRHCHTGSRVGERDVLGSEADGLLDLDVSLDRRSEGYALAGWNRQVDVDRLPALLLDDQFQSPRALILRGHGFPPCLDREAILHRLRISYFQRHYLIVALSRRIREWPTVAKIVHCVNNSLDQGLLLLYS